MKRFVTTLSGMVFTPEFRCPMDSVNILHDGCSGEDRGKKYSKLATTEQFYGAGTSKKVVPLRWCKATTAHAFTMGSPTVISVHEKT